MLVQPFREHLAGLSDFAEEFLSIRIECCRGSWVGGRTCSPHGERTVLSES